MSTNTKTPKQSTEETDFPRGARVEMDITNSHGNEKTVRGEVVGIDPLVVRDYDGRDYEVYGHRVEYGVALSGHFQRIRLLHESISEIIDEGVV